jgi:hypothetical protein
MTLKLVGSGRTSQVLSYLLKLLLFLHVPGVHLMATGRKKIGYLLLLPLIACSIFWGMMPVQVSHSWFFGLQVVILLLFLTTFISFIFVIFDLAKLGSRSIKPQLIVFSIIYLAVFYWPGDGEQLKNTELYLAFDQQMCPEICFGEFAAYTPVRETIQVKTIPTVGDIVVYEVDQEEFASRILASGGQVICMDNKPVVFHGNTAETNCKKNVVAGPKEYFVIGNDNAPGEWDQYVHQGLISSSQIIGINPVVVANWSEALSATFSTAVFLGDIYYQRN